MDWTSFLQEFSHFILADEENLWILPEYRERGYMGYPGATDLEIAAAETRLGLKFPPSYRSFLMTSNGWGPMGAACPGKLWSTGEIEFLSTRRQYLIDSYGDCSLSPEEHLRWQGKDCICFNGGYMKKALEISDDGDVCVLFLCPDVVTWEGEWECWDLASWKPGADRYPSLEGWFVSTYEALQEARQTG